MEFVGDLIVPERKTFLKQRSIVFVQQQFEEHKMATHSRVEVTPGTEGVPDEMMAELKKEIARNVEATKLVKQREMEATHARDMAADSQRRMQEMMDKYEEMKNKLEWTRLTLAETHSRLEKHNNSRSERLRQSVMELKEKAELTQQRLIQRSQGSAAAASEEVPPETSMPDAAATDPMAALGALGGMDSSAGGLTDAERMLLQMCQEQRKSADSVIEPEVPKKVEDEEEEPSQRLKNASRDYAKTVLDLQKKLSSSSKPSSSSPTNTGSQEDVSNSQPVSTESNSKTEEITSTAPVVETAVAEQVRETAVADHVERATSAAEESAVELAAAVAEAVAVQSPSSDEVNALASAAAEVDGLEMDLKMDLNVEKVAQMEAKVASVRETLGEMAMSEQYMRTKRAQLLARTREREAQLAMQLAEEKEKEAAEMRHKVKHMMLLLDERRNKLMATVDVLQKKSGVVEKVNKLLDSKERRANYVEKQRDECLAFDKKPKKN